MNCSAAMSKDRMIHEAQRIALNMEDMEVSAWEFDQRNNIHTG